mmetsp:Transcript_28923/g.44671  ORF Transcript_28923/g.44671 Transcript_28923/m.44671 type:complete len:643 (+) Transcript_28923:256-2184(+)
MSDSEEPTVTFVFKRDQGGAAANGGSLHMYAPKRKAAANGGSSSNNNNSCPPFTPRRVENHQSEQQTDEKTRARITMRTSVTDAEAEDEVTANNSCSTAYNKSPPTPSRFQRQVSSPHIDLDGSWSGTSPTSSFKNIDDSQRSQEDVNLPLYYRLTNQRWHEIGHEEYPLCATNDFDLMVEQLTAVLAARLTELLTYRLNKDRRMKQSNGEEYDGGSSMLDFLKLDLEFGNYVLEDEIMDSLREYVACIGRLHNNVGFHSFEHATHVFLSMNKLLSMVTSADDLNVVAKRRLSAQDIASSAFGVQSRRSSTDCNDSVGDSDGHRRRAEHLSFRISEDPAIRFAMVFSALIHDVGHTGVPNSVLIEEEDELAILHNDVSVTEQNSLQLAFSLLQKEEFQLLKRCIGPTPEERKLFRKKVIGMVMVTDISDQERLQIVKSRWNAAFPPPEVNQKEKPQILEIKSAELKRAAKLRRFTMFTSEATALEFANERRSRRLGIRTSMDFSGMLIEAYRDSDQLQQHAVLETMMNVADVAHTMQSFNVFVKWNRRLFKEFFVARLHGRLSFDPSENWYENQIGFFSHYIIPLSQKMSKCGVFGSAGSVFEYFAKENRKRWTEEGEEISEQIIREVTEEVERERQQQQEE